jgi:hypothetical protein
MGAMVEEGTVAVAATKAMAGRQQPSDWLEAILTWIYDLIGLPARSAEDQVEDIDWEDGEPREPMLPREDP